MSTKRFRVHSTYKIKHRVSNSAEYDQALINRGSTTFWLPISAIKKWNARPTKKLGSQAKYSNFAIETALTIEIVLNLPLRQTEGFVMSIFERMGLDVDAPDHTTLSRRSETLAAKLRFPMTKDLINSDGCGCSNPKAYRIHGKSQETRDSSQNRKK